MPSEKSRRSSSTRWLLLFVALLDVAAGCHARVVIGTEPSDDPSVPSDRASDDDDVRADAGAESDGDNVDDETGDESNDDDNDEDSEGPDASDEED